ncbi:MAG: hypothetical protein ACRYGA_06715 [Janthinobacterium lividum]
MSDVILQREIKWWDRKLLFRSLLVGLVFFGIFWGLAKRAEPPEGYVFERLPPVSGIYRCCDAGGRYSQSWVGGESINCKGLSYYHIGTGRNDCGLKEQLNGLFVNVEQIFVPAYDQPLRLVSKISLNGRVYYARNDQLIRERWIAGSKDDAFLLGFIIFVVFHTSQLIYLVRQ